MKTQVPGHVRTEDRKVYKLRKRIRDLAADLDTATTTVRSLRTELQNRTATIASLNMRVMKLEAALAHFRKLAESDAEV